MSKIPQPPEGAGVTTAGTVIAFAGTSCVGKTTLLEACRARWPECGFIEEAARQYFERFPMPEWKRFLAPIQFEIQSLALMDLRMATFMYPLSFADRSVFDAAAYVLATGDEAGAVRLLVRARNTSHLYRRIFLLDPSDVAYKPDQVRRETAENRWAFHDGFLRLFKLAQVEFELLSGSVEARLIQVQKATS